MKKMKKTKILRKAVNRRTNRQADGQTHTCHRFSMLCIGLINITNILKFLYLPQTQVQTHYPVCTSLQVDHD